MANRIVNRVGDIYSVDIGNGEKRFFQYIAKDGSAFNSQVIRVFKSKYPIDFGFDANQVIHDKVDFMLIPFSLGIKKSIGRRLGVAKTSDQ